MQRAFAYRTEQRKRQENQDSYGVFEFDDFVLAIVCDGMGGHVGGAQASALAVRTMHDTLRKETDYSDPGASLRRSLEMANQVIYEAARKNHRLMGMGTTAVAAIITNDGYVHVAHVGDSRAYLINDGQAIQVTRDHTMVNLFVDAELLTPEDAATHPEAHVLSRSLGVERQVEVEVSSPIELADADVVFLCSDGVHGVVTDWELGSVDWASAAPAIDHVLDIVDAREGDDNATAVAVRIGDGPSMAESPVPTPKPIEESLGASQHSSVIPEDFAAPFEDDVEAERGTEPSAPSRDLIPMAAPQLMPEDDPSSEYTALPQQVIATPKPTEKKKEPTPPPVLRRSPDQQAAQPGSKRTVVVLAGAVVLASGLLAAAYLATRPPSETGGTTLIANPEAPRTQPTEPRPLGKPAPTVNEPSSYFFAVEVPEAPRRLPHRPLRYTQPPPGGQHQFQAVQAARDNHCAESLDNVWTAMSVSPDYAQLYSQAWLCFMSTHSAPLAAAKITDPERFADLETHFRGWPAPGEPELQWTEEAKRLPLWYRPALDGVEYRLEAWANSDEDDRMIKVMTDLKGAPTITDQLAADLWVEATAAEALSKAEPLTPELEEAWARRVFVVASALEGRIGVLLRTHRPELLPVIEAKLAATTTETAPESVLTALGVARGEIEEPTTKPPAPAPVKVAKPVLKEPDLDGTGPNGGGGGKIIH